MWSSAVDSGLPETLICNLRGWRHWGHHPRVLVESAATLPEPPSGCGLLVHRRLIEQWGKYPMVTLGYRGVGHADSDIELASSVSAFVIFAESLRPNCRD